MVILGLTGSIGMGKSTAAAGFRRLGAGVFDADAAVHRLLAPGGRGVAPVAAAFPRAMRDSAAGRMVDRGALGKIVFTDPEALKKLEQILHPLVRRAERRYLLGAAMRNCRLVVLDIPLLFETGGDVRCDATVVVSAPAFVQRRRVFRRAGMTAARYQGILSRQMPDGEKRRRADFVVPTGLDRREAQKAITRIARDVADYPSNCWPRCWPATPRGQHA